MFEQVQSVKSESKLNTENYFHRAIAILDLNSRKTMKRRENRRM